MNINHAYAVHWRGHAVGRLKESVPDSWYLEGLWTPNDCAAAQEFTVLSSALDAAKVYRRPELGMRVLLTSEGEPTEPTHAIVLSLQDGRLWVRRVFDPEAVKWTLTNVP